MKTFQELKKWVEANVPKDRLEEETVEDSILWWVARRAAEAILEDGDTLDLATLLLEGVPPLTKKGVNEYLQQYCDEDSPKQEAELQEGLVRDLQEWFEIGEFARRTRRIDD